MDIQADEVLDCKGLSCPVPILKLAKAMKKLESGKIIEMQSTDPSSKSDVVPWCKKMGNEFLGVEDEGAVSRIFIRKA